MVSIVANAKRGLLLLLKVFLGIILLFIVIEIGLRVLEFGWRSFYRSVDNDGKFYIYVLGGSTSVGEPFHPQVSFPKLIAYAFDDTLNENPIEIINLAGQGMPIEYSYWAMKSEFFSRPRQNGLVLIYAGINEGIKYEINDPGFEKWKLIHHSLIIPKLIYNQDPNYFPNSVLKYRYHLEKAVEMAQRNHHQVILSTLVGNITEFDPDFRHWEYDFLQDHKMNYAEAKQAEADSNYSRAIQLYQALIKKFDQPLPYFYYRIACNYLALGKVGEAKTYFWKAIDTDVSIRPAHWKNEIIREVAKKYNTGLIEPMKEFESHSKNGLLGYSLFMDAHHPNLKGYILLSQLFVQEISKIFNTQPAHPHLKELDVMTHFGIDDSFMAQVYLEAGGWHIVEALFSNERTYRLNKGEEYLEKSRSIEPDNPDVELWRAVLSIIRGNSQKFKHAMNEGKLLSENKHVLEEFNHVFKQGVTAELWDTLAVWTEQKKIDPAVSEKMHTIIMNVP